MVRNQQKTLGSLAPTPAQGQQEGPCRGDHP